MDRNQPSNNDNFQYPLPPQTRRCFQEKQDVCDNLSLWLDRYIGYQPNWKFKEEQKIKFLNIVKEYKYPNKIIEANYKRWQNYTNHLPHSQHFTASPEWRMIVGLGQTSILETSMTLDRITGIPIITGSALKGLAASYALLCVLEKTKRIEEVEKVYQKYKKGGIQQIENIEQVEDFIQIFGTQEGEGKVIFLDAVPTKVPKSEPDIMNNHYPEYYQGTSAPTPYQNPIPVYFLTLGRDSQFAFAVAGTDHKVDKKLISQAKEWLQNGLQEMGIGAKTAAGYGYFVIP